MPNAVIDGMKIELKGLVVDRHRGLDGKSRPLDTLKVLKGTDMYVVSGDGATNAHYWLQDAEIPVSPLKDGSFSIRAQEVLAAARQCDKITQGRLALPQGYRICQELRNLRENEVAQMGNISGGITR